MLYSGESSTLSIFWGLQIDDHVYEHFHFTLMLACLNLVCSEKEALTAKVNELKAELSAITIQRDELEKCNLETRLQVLSTALV